MRFQLPAIAVLCLTSSCSAFVVQRRNNACVVRHNNAYVRPSPLLMSTSDESNDSDSKSRLEGNMRAPTAREIGIIDEIITKLAAASLTELPNAVSKAIRIASSPQFFLRIAQRVDMESDEENKEKLMALANNVSRTLEAVVSTTEQRLDERSKEVEQVVKAAAEPDSGEFLWPLTPEKADAIQKEIKNLDPGVLDESFLLTVDAWMNKSMQDGMDGMVGILQKVLQAFAGTSVSRARSALAAQVGAAVSGKSEEEVQSILEESEKNSDSASEVLDRLLSMDTERWDMEVKKAINSGECSQASLVKVLQGTMEGVVLGLENGSMNQQVQAEYLRELMTRIEGAVQ